MDIKSWIKNIRKEFKVNDEQKMTTEKGNETEETILKSLANDGHTYWKFSQSQKGRSIEPVYIEYTPGKIVVAKDDDKFLSFVNEDNIARCYMYGDQLTKFTFDMGDAKFQTISDEKYIYRGGGLGEYESRRLLTEENYSLNDINTIIMLIKMIKKPMDFFSFYKSSIGANLKERLKSYGYNESVDFLEYIENNYVCDSIDEIRKILSSIDSIADDFRKIIMFPKS